MTNTEVIKRFSEAFGKRDAETINELVVENYVFEGPMATINSRNELIEFMQNMPMEFTESEHTYIEQNNKVSKSFVVDFAVPPIGAVDMCEVFTLEDGKITHAKMFYDTALFPKPEEQAA